MEQTLRQHARDLFSEALKAADPTEAIRRHVEVKDDQLVLSNETPAYHLRDFANLYVIGAGKAGAAMAQGIEDRLGDWITSGLVNVPYESATKLRRIEFNECRHPIPDQNGVDGSSRIAAMAEKAGTNDLVICIISGGASALLPRPAAPITLKDKQATTDFLQRSGANIHELNAVRKHISQIKGGQLAQLVSRPG